MSYFYFKECRLPSKIRGVEWKGKDCDYGRLYGSTFSVTFQDSPQGIEVVAAPAAGPRAPRPLLPLPIPCGLLPLEDLFLTPLKSLIESVDHHQSVPTRHTHTTTACLFVAVAGAFHKAWCNVYGVEVGFDNPGIATGGAVSRRADRYLGGHIQGVGVPGCEPEVGH